MPSTIRGADLSHGECSYDCICKHTRNLYTFSSKTCLELLKRNVLTIEDLKYEHEHLKSFGILIDGSNSSESFKVPILNALENQLNIHNCVSLAYQTRQVSRLTSDIAYLAETAEAEAEMVRRGRVLPTPPSPATTQRPLSQDELSPDEAEAEAEVKLDSSVLIDHVYTNKLDNTLSCNILTLDLSDHLATHTRVLLNKTKTKHSNKFRNKRNDISHDIRIFNEANNETFKNLVNNETWEEITDDLDAQNSYEKFHEIYMKHYDTAFPLNSQRVRRKNERKDPKPWILPWLEDACARKQDVYEIFVTQPTPANKIKYDKMNAFCKKHTDLGKAKYHKKYFDEHRENSKKQWQMINSLLGRKNNSKSIKKLIDPNGTVINTPSIIAENFNNFFANIAGNLKEENNRNLTGSHDHNQFLKNTVSNSIYLNQVTSDEIYNIIKNFKNKSTLDI